MATTIELKNSVTTGNSPSSLAQGETGWNITDKKVWIGNASSTPIQIIGAGASMTLTSLTTNSDSTIHGLTVGLGGGSVSTNTALGNQALYAGTTVSNSVAIGYQAMQGIVTGTDLVGVGLQSLYSNTSGSSNSALGRNSLWNNTTGSYNSALGSYALYSNTTASNNTAVGYQAGYSNTTGGIEAVGYQALYGNTTGSGNIAFGTQALFGNTTGTQNTALGHYAGLSITTSSNLTAVGNQSLYNATGGANTAVGQYSGNGVTTGTSNAFFGQASGYLITTGSYNTVIGSYSGNQGGLDIRTASNYIVLSDGAGNPRGVFDGSGNFQVGQNGQAGLQNLNGFSLDLAALSIVVNHASGTGSGTTYQYFGYAGSGIGSISQVGTTAVLYNTTSDYRLKTNVAPIQNALNTVEALNPVSFTWVDGRKDDGFIAHEIQAVIPNCVTGEKDAVNEDGTPKYQQMDNSGVIPFLVKAIQELNAKVTALETQLGAK